MAASVSPKTAPEGPSLRRSVTPWGSFSWGYSDVGADIFVGLGPRPGRCRRRVERGLSLRRPGLRLHRPGVHGTCCGLSGRRRRTVLRLPRTGRHLRLHRRLGGAARLHDRHRAVRLELHRLPEQTHPDFELYGNILGFISSWSSASSADWRCSTSSACARARLSTNSSAALDVVSETAILFFGFLFAFSPELLVHTMQTAWPTPFNLMNGVSLAIISFVGLESIAQAAQETQRPASVIPRTSISLILTILIFALAYSNLALGMHPWHPLPLDKDGHVASPLALSRQRGEQRRGRRGPRIVRSLLGRAGRARTFRSSARSCCSSRATAGYSAARASPTR